MKGFSAFLDMRRCKDARIMKSVPENISLSKDLFYQFSWHTKCLILHPELPSGRAEGQQLEQHRSQSLQRQMANALVVQL